MDVQVEMIQPGWSVFASDGQEIGTVIGVESDGIRIKKGGLLGGELRVPRTSVQEVETGRVELSITKKEAESNRS
jgi:hypothetical protein